MNQFIYFIILLLFIDACNICQAQDTSSAKSIDSSLVNLSSTSDTIVKKDSIIVAIPYFIPDSIIQMMLDTTKHIAKWQPSPPSIYINHEAGKIFLNKKQESPIWLFILFIIQLLILAYLKMSSLKNIEDSLKAYFNLNLAQQLLREQEGVITISGILQVLNFLISISILAFLAIQFYFNVSQYNSFYLYSIIFIAITIIYFLKYSGYKLISYVFPFADEVNNFRFNYFLNQKLLGFALMPLIYASAYNMGYWAKFFLIAALALFIVSVIVRSAKGIIIGLKQLQKNTFHFLLYICAFEIAPILILLKWLHMVGYGQ